MTGTDLSSWFFPSYASASSVTPAQGASGVRVLASAAEAAASCEAGSIGLGASAGIHDARDNPSAGIPASPDSGRGGDRAREQGQEGFLGVRNQERFVSQQNNFYQLQLQHQLRQSWPASDGATTRTPSASPTAALSQRHRSPGTPFAVATPGFKYISGWARLTCSTTVALAAILLAISLINLALTSFTPSIFLGMALPDPPGQQPGKQQHLLDRLSREMQKLNSLRNSSHREPWDSPDARRQGQDPQGRKADASGDSQKSEIGEKPTQRKGSVGNPGKSGKGPAAGLAEERRKSGERREAEKSQEEKNADDTRTEGGKAGRKHTKRNEDKKRKEEPRKRRGRQKGGDKGEGEAEGTKRDKGRGKHSDQGRGKQAAKDKQGKEGTQAMLFADDPEEARSRVPLSASCNVSDGRWIRDDSYPLWRQGTCLLDQAGFSCERPATYAPYRWQPRTCNIPRFVVDDVRERLRGRRLAFVGDSLARNQFQSAVCMLAAGLPNGTVTNVAEDEWGKKAKWVVYRFHDFNFTVEFILSHHQVPIARRDNDTYLPDIKFVLDTGTVDWFIPGKLLNAGNLESLIVVFNAGHWYTEGKLMKSGIYFQVNGTAYEDMPLLQGYRAALGTLAAWMQELQEKNVTTVWRTYVPTHFLGGAWDTGGSCRDKDPMPGLEGWKSDQLAWMTASQEYLNAMLEAAHSVPRPPLILDVTHMSLLRSDAHIGEYAHRKFDCSHWCMPGVPDIWNELMFAMLKQRSLL